MHRLAYLLLQVKACHSVGETWVPCVSVTLNPEPSVSSSSYVLSPDVMCNPRGRFLRASVGYDEGFADPTVVPGTLVRTLSALYETVKASADSRSLAS